MEKLAKSGACGDQWSKSTTPVVESDRSASPSRKAPSFPWLSQPGALKIDVRGLARQSDAGVDLVGHRARVRAGRELSQFRLADELVVVVVVVGGERVRRERAAMSGVVACACVVAVVTWRRESRAQAPDPEPAPSTPEPSPAPPEPEPPRAWFFVAEAGPSYQRIYATSIYGGRFALAADVELPSSSVTIGASFAYGELDTGLHATQRELGPAGDIRLGRARIGAGIDFGFLSISTVSATLNSPNRRRPRTRRS